MGKKGKKLIARSSIEPTCQSEAGSSLPFPALVDSGAKPRGRERDVAGRDFVNQLFIKKLKETRRPSRRLRPSGPSLPPVAAATVRSGRHVDLRLPLPAVLRGSAPRAAPAPHPFWAEWWSACNFPLRVDRVEQDGYLGTIQFLTTMPYCFEFFRILLGSRNGFSLTGR